MADKTDQVTCISSPGSTLQAQGSSSGTGAGSTLPNSYRVMGMNILSQYADRKEGPPTPSPFKETSAGGGAYMGFGYRFGLDKK